MICSRFSRILFIPLSDLYQTMKHMFGHAKRVRKRKRKGASILGNESTFNKGAYRSKLKGNEWSESWIETLKIQFNEISFFIVSSFNRQVLKNILKKQMIDHCLLPCVEQGM